MERHGTQVKRQIANSFFHEQPVSNSMKPFLTLKSVDEVLVHIGAFEPLQKEIVGLGRACGRRIAQDFFAPDDLPGFARSTVDGFAAAAADTFGANETSPAILKCIGDCLMGQKPAFELAPGEAARILTGGMLPKGADCVIMVEYSRPACNNLVEISRTGAPGENIVEADEDAGSGALLIPAGKALRPQEIGCLAAFGIENVSVCRRPVVAVISTGDEIVPIQAAPAQGQVRDVNSHSLAALLQESGARVMAMGLIKDDKPALQTTLRSALQAADVVVVSGGSSAGSRDFTVDAFLGMPEAALIAHGVAIRPGKPFILARAGQKALIGLPGHVSGALICARVFILPLLQRLQGARKTARTPMLPAVLTRSIASAQGRRDYIRCVLSGPDSLPEATPLPSSSAVITGLVAADGLIVCPENREGFSKGEKVMVELI